MFALLDKVAYIANKRGFICCIVGQHICLLKVFHVKHFYLIPNSRVFHVKHISIL